MRLSNRRFKKQTTGGAVQDHIKQSYEELRAGIRAGVTALRADFVAKPETIPTVREGLEERILTSWGEEPGFLNGMVLVSDQEARLTTVITFWKAGTIERTREQKVHWLQKILKPYLDRCLQVQTNSTYFLSRCDGYDPQASGAAAHLQRAAMESPVLCVV